MWKACWDCVAGNVGLNEPQNDVYETPLNSDRLKKRTWPPNDKMLNLPRQLHNNDKIEMLVNLTADPQMVACALCSEEGEVFKFIGNFTTNVISLVTFKDGQKYSIGTNNTTAQMIPNSTFTITMMLHSSYGENVLNLFIDGSTVELVSLESDISVITHVAFEGDVQNIGSFSVVFG